MSKMSLFLNSKPIFFSSSKNLLPSILVFNFSFFLPGRLYFVLCFYPLPTAVAFNIGEPCLVVEDNFGRCGGGSLIKIKDDQNYMYNFFWAVQTFRLAPKFLREFALKLYEKVSE